MTNKFFDSTVSRWQAAVATLGLSIFLTACGASEKSSVQSEIKNQTTPVMSLANAAPSTVFGVGYEYVTYSRMDEGNLRSLTTKIWYPAAYWGSGAPIASGKFPLILFSHGLGSTSDYYGGPVGMLVEAGFIVAAPEYPYTKPGSNYNYDDAWWGKQSLDASEVITKVLERGNIVGDRFYGHIDASAGVGAAGQSLGGVTTNGLLGLRRDNRITSAMILSGGSVAKMSGPPVKVFLQHGDDDYIESLPYWRAKQIYNEIPASWPKAFLILIGGGHTEYLWGSSPSYNQTTKTTVDWFRWSLYGDAAALGRLPSDAQLEGKTIWESSNLVNIRLEAENFTSNYGVYTEPCSEGGINVGWIDNHDWMTWDVNIPVAGTYTIQYRVSSPYDTGLIQFEKAGGYPVYGTIKVPYTGGWQNWTTISHQVTLPAGQQTIAIHATAGGFNINWLKIIP